MIFLRSALFNVVFFGVTFLLSAIGTILRPIVPRAVLGVAILWARIIIGSLRLICGIRFEVTGWENLPAGAALIASRHQSAFDTVIWLTLVPRCCYILKKELVRIPLFGKLTLAAGMIAVDRDSGAAAIRTLRREGARAMRERRQMVIFPEGTRAEPGTMLPLQPGVAALAAGTGLPVIPVITDSGLYWGRRAFRKRPGTIHIVIKPPLPTGLRRGELMEQLRHALAMPVNDPAQPVDKFVDRDRSRFSAR
jgi:1-acyl-sn-glycerol-3-phosphate acyltransferase